ncbi:MAG: Ig-like domain-containing protein, partial [Taibaiella sp.]|nr:Ig-like domain-containing protein [Taibaiella sp.]
SGSSTATVSLVGTYVLRWTVNNGTCTPATADVTVNYYATPQGSLTANGPFCTSGIGQLTWTASSGTGPFIIVYDDGTVNQTANNIVSGIPFNVATNPVTGTTIYTLISVTDNNGCPRSSSFTGSSSTITVNDPPFIATQPDITQSVCATLPVSFSVIATGTGLTYQWYKRNIPFDIALTDVVGVRSGTTTSTLNINQAAGSDAGIYYVIVIGLAPCGSVTSGNSILIVDQQIFITSQPTSQIGCAGTTATFSVSATGIGLSYQWRIGNTPIPIGGRISVTSGANTSTLTINNISAADASATYNVQVTSPGGPCPLANSANVTLTVNPLPTVNAGATQAAICQGGTTVALGGSFGGGATAAVWSDGLSGPTAGTFANNAGGTPGTATYTASASAPASVTLTLTTSGGSCGTVFATKSLTINPSPTVDVGGAVAAICQGGTTVALGGSFGGGATGAVWSDGLSGPTAGTFANNAGGTPGTATYTASASAPASVTLTLTTSGGSCGTIFATKSLTINPSPTVSVGGAVAAICQGGTTVALGGSFGGGATAAVWSDGLSGPTAGTFANNSGGTPGTATYTASVSAPALVTLTLITSGGSCGTISATKSLTINPSPTVNAGGAVTAICQGGTTVALGGSFGGGATAAVWSDGLSGPTAGTFANNSGGTPGTAAYTASASAPASVTLTLTTSGGLCGTTFTSKSLTVYPNFTISPLTQTICSGTAVIPIVISGAVTSTITWSRDNIGPVTGIPNGSNSASISGLLTNTTANPVTVTFTITASTSNGCTTTRTATVIVDANITAPVASASQIVCLFASPAPLTATAATGGNNIFTYKWQHSNDGSTNWIDIANTNSLTYQPPSTSEYYRIVATTACGSITSNVVQISFAFDLGLTFNGSGAPTAPLCSSDNFTYSLSSSSFLSIFSSNYVRYVWQAQSPANITSPIPSGTPYGVTNTVGFFNYFVGTATFTIQNPTNAVINTNLLITPIVYGNSGNAVCNLSATTIPVVINPNANAGIVAGTTPLCIGATATYTSNGTIGGAWSSSNTAVATVVAGTGVVTAAGAGTTNIIYTVTTGCTAPKAAQKLLTVSPNANAGTVSGTTPLCIGATATYTSNGDPGGAWSSSNTAVATIVAGTGVVTAVGGGTTNIMYTVSTGCNSPKTAQKLLTVSPNANAGTVSGTTPLCIGATATYTSNGDAGGVWSSSNTAVATVVAGTGVVTALSSGTANIIYTVSTGCTAPKTAQQLLTVSPNANAGTVSGITPLCIGTTATYTSNGDAGGAWSSSNTAVATVVAGTGLVTAVGGGTTNIIYTVSTGCTAPKTAQKLLTVSPDANAGTVSGTTPLCIGETATYTNNGDAGGVWSSSNTAVATIVAGTGVVTAVSAGTSDITYTVNSGCNSPKSAFKTVTVSPNANAGIVSGITPLCVGSQVQYSSTGDAGGTWSSSVPAVATVTNSGVVKALSVGTSDITYTVNSGCSSPTSATKMVTVVSVGPSLDPGPISGPVQVCQTSTGFVYSVAPDLSGNTSFYVWTVPSGWTITSGSTTNSITLSTNNAAVNGNITATAGNACGFSTTSTIAVKATAIGQWIGITADWNDGQNWCSGIPPTSLIDVTIPAGTPNDPIISTATAMTHNITIASMATLKVIGQTFQIAGSVFNSGSFNAINGTLELNGSTTQSIAGSMFASNTLQNLIISNTGAGLNLMGSMIDTLKITGAVSFGSVTGKVLNTGGHLTLLSSFTSTAWVADLTNNDITGDVTVERYINTGPGQTATAHGKSWQLLAVPTSGTMPGINGQTIKNAWQEGDATFRPTVATPIGNPKPGYGTMLVSNVPNAGNQPTPGFDQYTAPGPSIKVYDYASNTYRGPATTQVPVYNQKGYLILVRGDRSVYTFNAPATPTILRTTGLLFTPNHLPPVTNVVANNFESVGNPYASEIDLIKLSNTGIAGGVQKIYYVYDPRAADYYGLGAYQTLSQLRLGGPSDDNFYPTPGGGSYVYGVAHNYIESGQAFFVSAFFPSPNPGGQVTFNESNKINGSDISLLRPQRAPGLGLLQLRTNVYTVNNGTGSLIDGTLIQYNSTYSNALDGMDARKLANIAENLSIKSGGKDIAIERRQPIVETDTVFYSLKNSKIQTYRFEFIADNLDTGAGLEGFLEDNYLHTRTPVSLSGTTLVDFSVANVAGSYATDRFRIVFAPAKALPVTFTSVKAYRQGSNINVEWIVDNEMNIKNYDVEKSADGLHFTTLTTTAATANGGRSASYLAADARPVNGYNYYRIRSNDLNSKTEYTSIVKVFMGRTKQDIVIYPNPITDGMVHLQFMNEPDGKYGIRLMNKLGQVIVSKQVTRMDGNSTELIKWDFNLAHGMYQLEITKPDGSTKNINVYY